MCAPVARKARARDQDRNLRSASTSIPAPKQLQQVHGQRLLRGRYGPIDAPSRLPVPDSAAATHRACGNAPNRDWLDGRPKNAPFLLAVRHVRDRSVHRDDPQPAAEHPGSAICPCWPRYLLEQHPDRFCAQLAAAPRQGGDVRLLPPPALPGIRPAVRVQLLPGQQVRGAPLVIQAVGQLGHHLPVPAVPAPEQPQRQHEIHHQPRRQQPAPLLPDPRRVHGRIDRIRRESPGQHPDRDPVRQPPVRRQPLRTIMSHKTVTISHNALKQGHWVQGHRPRLWSI